MAQKNHDMEDTADKFDQLNFVHMSSDFSNFETLGSIIDYPESDSDSGGYESDASSLSNIFEQSKYTGTLFEELWSTFSRVSDEDEVRKKIIKKGNGISTKANPFVKVQLSGYWEDEKKPFEYDKNAIWDLENDYLMPGLLTAVESMEIGEYSMFLLSYKVMYGELGCPPRIRPKSTCLYHIRILGSMKESDRCSNAELSFEVVFGKVNTVCLQGDSFYKKELFARAESCFKSALQQLNNCPLADEAESKKFNSKSLYIHLYLTMCYVKMKQPKRACCMCNDMKNIDLNAYNRNYRALYQNGLALMMIGDIEKAEQKFLQAIRIKPDNSDIKTQLDQINEIKKKKTDKGDYVKMMSEGIAYSKKT